MIFDTVILFACCYIQITSAQDILSQVPASRNVSADSTVQFRCATPYSMVILSWSGVPAVANTVQLPNGGRMTSLTLTATAELNGTSVVCTGGGVLNQRGVFVKATALLLVQGILSPVGNLTSTEVDHCTIRLTWTAPYTLQGVSINYYTINITRHSDGAVLRSDTTNTTEYLYTVSSLGETLEVEVTPVNDVGTGNATSILIQPFKNSEMNDSLLLKQMGTSRIGNNWTYFFHIKGKQMCENSIEDINVYSCNGATCYNSTSQVITSQSSRENTMIKATFTGLPDKTKYSTHVKIHFRGGKIQQTQKIQTSTFDIQNLSIGSVGNGTVCLTVCLAQGSSNSVECFIKLECTTGQADAVTAVIEGSTGCIVNLPPCTYTVSVTDMDASNSIDTNPALIHHGLVIPSSTDNTTQMIPTSPSKCSTVFTDQDTEESPEATASCSSTALIILITSIAMMMITIVLNITTTLLCLKCHAPKKAPKPQVVARNPIIRSPVHASIRFSITRSPLHSASAVYETINFPAEDVELQSCAAYGIVVRP